MTEDERRVKAAELTAQIMAARVSAAAGRPNAAEGADAAAYFRAIHVEVSAVLAGATKDE